MSLLNEPNAQQALPPAGDAASPARQWWRSMAQRGSAPEFEEQLHREFPKDASEMTSAFSRRAFLNLMAASAALAGGLTGCRRPEQKIMPYSRIPEDLVEGVAQHYATSAERWGFGVGVVARSNEGRPTHLQGNPLHPASLGGLDPVTQARLLDLYDPDRSQAFLRDGKRVSRKVFDAYATGRFGFLRELQGQGLAVLAPPSASPSLQAARARLMQAMPRARWFTWEAAGLDNEIQGLYDFYGQPSHPYLDLEKADRILALDSDFLTSGPGALRYARQFAARRRAQEGAGMNRLYAVEPMMTPTGGMADHRMTLAAGHMACFLEALTAELGRAGMPFLEGWDVAGALSPEHELDMRWVRAVARDLAAHPGHSVIVLGPAQPPHLHALVAWLNQALAGECVRYVPAADPWRWEQGAPGFGSLLDLCEAMEQGALQTLVILEGNPVFDAPANLDFASGLAKVEHTIHLSLEVNETSAACMWHVPQAHFLEAWGDTRSLEGTLAPVQPLIAPLFGGVTPLEMLSIMTDAKPRGAYEMVREHYRGALGEEEFERFWQRSLNEGVLGRAGEPQTMTPRTLPPQQGQAWAAKHPAVPSADALEVIFRPDPAVHDGRHANNGWLQETPDPVSKLTWDNAALMSPATAGALGVENEEMVLLEAGGRQIELPVWIQPGVAPWTLVLHLGYGRRQSGRVGRGTGTDVYPLRTSAAPYILSGVNLQKTGRRRKLACVQDHWAMEGRRLIVEDEGEHYLRNAALAAAVHGEEHAEQQDAHAEHHDDPFGHPPGEHPPLKSLWKSHSYEEGYQWGMSIDLSVCTGCNACMVACQSENNVPVVGKDRVLEGREMSWIRVDRYFEGDPENPRMAVQPVACQHCENAPCEQVCPVAATTHSPEGLNEMAYNRCIGTRYCSNNCPYKVRRFNFFNYHEELFTGGQPDLVKMASNPDVTVRMRGVMEKCTFCVQRINRARIEAKGEDRSIADGEVVTACQSVCPAQAIVFGDVNDPASAVVRAKSEHRSYHLLEEYNVRPRLSYLGRLRNTNPELKA